MKILNDSEELGIARRSHQHVKINKLPHANSKIQISALSSLTTFETMSQRSSNNVVFEPFLSSKPMYQNNCWVHSDFIYLFSWCVWPVTRQSMRSRSLFEPILSNIIFGTIRVSEQGVRHYPERDGDVTGYLACNLSIKIKRIDFSLRVAFALHWQILLRRHWLPPSSIENKFAWTMEIYQGYNCWSATSRSVVW